MRKRAAVVITLVLFLGLAIGTAIAFVPPHISSSEVSSGDLNPGAIPPTSMAPASYITSYPEPSLIEISSATLTVSAKTLTADPTYQAWLQIIAEETAHPAPTIQPVGMVREVYGGILYEDGMGAGGFAVHNIWMTRHGENMFEVQAGIYSVDVQPAFPTPSDPKYHPPLGPVTIPYGALRVVEITRDWKTLATNDYITPIPAGALAIVDVIDGLFYLRTGLGEELVFDLARRMYVGGKRPGEPHILGDGMVETRPNDAPQVDGFVPYAEWQLQDMQPPLRVTAYISERVFSGGDNGCLVLSAVGDSKPLVLSVPGEYVTALRAVRLVEDDYLVFFEDNSYPIVLDLKQRRLLGESDAVSVMEAAKKPFSWP